jgi:hypothetical protein
MTDDREHQVRILARKFGFCGCKHHCQLEQYGEEGNESKPRGRFSVCELEADKYGIEVPEKGEGGEYEDAGEDLE